MHPVCRLSRSKKARLEDAEKRKRVLVRARWLGIEGGSGGLLREPMSRASTPRQYPASSTTSLRKASSTEAQGQGRVGNVDGRNVADALATLRTSFGRTRRPRLPKKAHAGRRLRDPRWRRWISFRHVSNPLANTLYCSPAVSSPNKLTSCKVWKLAATPENPEKNSLPL